MIDIIKDWENKEAVKIQKEDMIEEKLKSVSFARNAIKSNLFSEDQITKICDWLHFTDTAFKDMKSENKLKDFLLDKKYWKRRYMLDEEPVENLF